MFRRTVFVASYNQTLAAKLTNCSGRTYLSLALTSLILLSGTPVLAQVAGAANPASQTHSSHTSRSIEDRARVFAKALDLNEEQQVAVKKILQQRQQETMRIRLDPSIVGSARIERFRALQENTVERIRAVLNEEQRKKYDPLAARRIQAAPEQRSVEDWLKVTTAK